MSFLSRSMAVARFELVRSITMGRLSTVVVLALFPPFVTTVVALTSRGEGTVPVLGVTLLMVCLLSLLLWATPLVYSELEGKTWVFAAARPSGRISLMTGKYFVAVAWSIFIGVVALTLSLAMSSLVALQGTELRTWLVYFYLVVLASFSYGAVFTFIGAMFYRRGMVVAAAYTFVSELILAFIPAVVNRITIRYHLQSLALQGLGWQVKDVDPVVDMMLGGQPIWQHLGMLLGICTLFLSASIYVLRSREYICSADI